MVRIHILSATDRPNANAYRVARYADQFLSEKAKTKIFSLEDFPLKDVVGGKYNDKPTSVEEFNKKFLNADGFVFVVPEYNGGFPGILKLFYDYLPFPEALDKVPVCLIGEAAGEFGALRPIEHFTQLLIYRQAHVFSERMFIQRVNDSFDEKDGLTSEKIQKLWESQLNGFPDFVENIKSSLIEP